MSPTRAVANAAPAPSVIISEVMYWRPSTDGQSDNMAGEYLELFNPASTAVDLFTSNGGWRLAGGVDWTFAPGTRLAAGETLLVVGFDPANATALNLFSAITRVEEGVRLEFPAMPGRVYRVEYDGALPGQQDWQLLAELVGLGELAVQSVTDPNPLASPFRTYRLRVSTTP